MKLLSVTRDQITDSQGTPVRLRGFGVGGWLNTENFINGYPGFESGLRQALSSLLGPARAEFLWNRMLDHFLAEADIAFMKECGATVVRLPLNYRLFESDAEPFHYLVPGFERLDRVLEWCRRHELYAILDLHAVQGWQDPDWHSDNYGRLTLIWTHRQFQERFIALWEEFARRYQGDPVIAGYDVMNEPVTGAPYGFFGHDYQPDWPSLNDLYRRTVAAIRRIDPEHIIFLEGDLFSTLFSGLEPPFAQNLVYSSHHYVPPCFGPGPYPGLVQGQRWDRARLTAEFARQEGTRFCNRHHVPLWIGEFGAAFDVPDSEFDYRLQALSDQLSVFEENQAHWTIWTYKDIGMMGLVTVAPDSAYVQAIRPVLELKHQLSTDSWVRHRSQTVVQTRVHELANLILSILPETGVDRARFEANLEQAVLGSFTATFMQPLWTRCFAGRDNQEIDHVMSSFALANCQVNPRLRETLSRYFELPA